MTKLFPINALAFFITLSAPSAYSATIPIDGLLYQYAFDDYGFIDAGQINNSAPEAAGAGPSPTYGNGSVSHGNQDLRYSVPNNAASGFVLRATDQNYGKISSGYYPNTDSFTFSANFRLDTFSSEHASTNSDGDTSYFTPLLVIQGGDFREGAHLGINNATEEIFWNVQAGAYTESTMTRTAAPFTVKDLSKWHNVTAVWDRSAAESLLYLDGVLRERSPASSLSPIEPSWDMLIGAYRYSSARGGYDSPYRSGDALIDDVRIYNRALSPEESFELAVNMSPRIGLGSEVLVSFDGDQRTFSVPVGYQNAIDQTGLALKSGAEVQANASVSSQYLASSKALDEVLKATPYEVQTVVAEKVATNALGTYANAALQGLVNTSLAALVRGGTVSPESVGQELLNIMTSEHMLTSQLYLGMAEGFALMMDGFIDDFVLARNEIIGALNSNAVIPVSKIETARNLKREIDVAAFIVAELADAAFPGEPSESVAKNFWTAVENVAWDAIKSFASEAKQAESIIEVADDVRNIDDISKLVLDLTDVQAKAKNSPFEFLKEYENLARERGFVYGTAPQDPERISRIPPDSVGTVKFPHNVASDGANAKLFDFDVAEGAGVRVDPPIAVGYDFRTGDGDPNFMGVKLPVIEDTLYDLWLFDNVGSAFDTGIDLTGGVWFDFTTGLSAFGVGVGGINAFRILGIETDDAEWFVSELYFVESGRFTGSQTPVFGSAGVPTPSALLLLITGIVLLHGQYRQWFQGDAYVNSLKGTSKNSVSRCVRRALVEAGARFERERTVVALRVYDRER
ncbi:LamG domain-containing protein [uncultured Thiohalocapsa sp.]|uniref:LamG domain-containing protein n=1 Tax=uncultured Thiohalocapsa sp. TaxID=768990 RepID=UPI0025FF6B29|nr:LamG domain-containing protein [uncultured Thiohalocapsa sp.]